ncbi:MAG: HAMP domain-containing protein [Treponema sp.]|jgi:adenylate cyclase|nr:HAMP domain-containing protein [Treponema sp.]
MSVANRELSKYRVLFPIGAKLIIIIFILLLVSLGVLTVLVSVISTQDVRRTAEDNNFTVNRRAGSQAESLFRSIQSAVFMYLEIIDLDRGIANRNPDFDSYFFGRNRNIAAIGVRSGAAGWVVVPNDQFFIANNADGEGVNAWFSSNSGLFVPAEGKIRFFNASPDFRIPLVAMIFPRQGVRGTSPDAVVVLFSPEELSESFGTGANSSFMIDEDGELLIHSDGDLVFGGANFSALPVIKTMREEGDNNRQVSFTDAGGVDFFGAYYRIPGTDSVVITVIPHSAVFEAVRSITRQNIYLTVAVLFAAVLFVWFFSKTISTPVRALVDAALQIEQGEFGLTLEPGTRDEIGLLTESFGKMSSALGIFGRFTNKDIAVRAMKGEIKPGGLSRHATIFFSDIRGFTEKSENFTKKFGEEASARIVAWLNRYFTRMVDCVEKTNGVVDKFIGDAVMAHWGTAYTAGTPEEDAFNCVRAALMMRRALIELNTERGSRDDPEIRIGCGINTGVVTAGQIGSEQRMEYTAIGDPVNLASRTEALNKPLGTDILITEDTWNLAGDRFITEEMPPVTVKGKEKPVRLFAVVNFRDTEEGPRTLAEVRTLLGISAPDISKVDTDAEEKKYKIQGG